eukprot:356820-Chlamydomonas_euryale.AAC.1
MSTLRPQGAVRPPIAAHSKAAVQSPGCAALTAAAHSKAAEQSQAAPLSQLQSVHRSEPRCTLALPQPRRHARQPQRHTAANPAPLRLQRAAQRGGVLRQRRCLRQRSRRKPPRGERRRDRLKTPDATGVRVRARPRRRKPGTHVWKAQPRREA